MVAGCFSLLCLAAKGFEIGDFGTVGCKGTNLMLRNQLLGSKGTPKEKTQMLLAAI